MAFGERAELFANVVGGFFIRHFPRKLVGRKFSISVPPNVIDFVTRPGRETWHFAKNVPQHIGSATTSTNNDDGTVEADIGIVFG